MRRSSIRLLVQCSFKCRVNLECELDSDPDKQKKAIMLSTRILSDFSILGKLWGNPLHPNINVVALVDQVCMHLIQNEIGRLCFSRHFQIPAAPNQSLPDILDL